MKLRFDRHNEVVRPSEHGEYVAVATDDGRIIRIHRDVFDVGGGDLIAVARAFCDEHNRGEAVMVALPKLLNVVKTAESRLRDKGWPSLANALCDQIAAAESAMKGGTR